MVKNGATWPFKRGSLGDGSIAVCMYLTVRLKKVKVLNFVLCVFYHIKKIAFFKKLSNGFSVQTNKI